MNWNEIVQKVTPYVVKIETPNGHGTGFLCLYNENKSVCGIATAYHVVDHADEWQQPIRIRHYASLTSSFVQANERAVLSDPKKDSAVIMMNTGELQFPDDLIPLLPLEHRLPIGAHETAKQIKFIDEAQKKQAAEAQQQTAEKTTIEKNTTPLEETEEFPEVDPARARSK